MNEHWILIKDFNIIIKIPTVTIKNASRNNNKKTHDGVFLDQLQKYGRDLHLDLHPDLHHGYIYVHHISSVIPYNSSARFL